MPQVKATGPNILICEDDPTFQEELVRILTKSFETSTLGCFSEPESILDFTSKTQIDLVIMDLYFFGHAYRGIELLESISQIAPDSRRVVFTAHIPHDPELYRLWKAGLHGYFLKNARLEQLVPRLERILQGENIFDWMVENRLQSMPEYHPEPGPEALSEKQKEVAIRIAQGQTLEEIAAHMKITYSSARVHRNRSLKKLMLASDIDLVRYCFRHRLIDQ